VQTFFHYGFVTNSHAPVFQPGSNVEVESSVQLAGPSKAAPLRVAKDVERAARSWFDGFAAPDRELAPRIGPITGALLIPLGR
jgi:hypothetical protein